MRIMAPGKLVLTGAYAVLEGAPAIVVRGVAIKMPDHAWRKQELLVSNAPVFDFLEMSDRASAILGPGLLKDNSLAIDFQGGQLYLGPAIDQSQN